MGFMGGAKRVNGETVPAFVLFTGGSEDLGKEKLGKERGVLSAIDIPQFIVGGTSERSSNYGKLQYQYDLCAGRL